MVNELAELGEESTCSGRRQTHEFFRAKMAHNACLDQVQGVVKKTLGLLGPTTQTIRTPSTMARPSRAQQDRIHAEKRSRSG